MIWGLLRREGWASDSVFGWFSIENALSSSSLFLYCCNEIHSARTDKTNHINSGTMFCQTQSMVLHAWTASNITQNNDLHRCFFFQCELDIVWHPCKTTVVLPWIDRYGLTTIVFLGCIYKIRAVRVILRWCKKDEEEDDCEEE